MPVYSYTVSDATPFTKIASSDWNSRFNDVKTWVNWAGGTSATTGLNDSNIQSNTVSGGALTRSSKLKAGTANYVVINDSGGLMTEEAQLASSRGGTGADLSGAKNVDDVIKWNGSAFTTGVSPVPPALRPVTYFLYS